MAILPMSNHQSYFQYNSFPETNKELGFSVKWSQKMNFLLPLITDSSSSKKKDPYNNDDNFPKDKWWKCLKPNCGAYNLRSVWKCAYCGTPR